MKRWQGSCAPNKTIHCSILCFLGMFCQNVGPSMLWVLLFQKMVSGGLHQDCGQQQLHSSQTVLKDSVIQFWWIIWHRHLFSSFSSPFPSCLVFLGCDNSRNSTKKNVPLLNESHVKPLFSSLGIYFRLFGPPKKYHLDSVRPGHLWQQSQQQPPKSLCSISLKVSSNSWDFCRNETIEGLSAEKHNNFVVFKEMLLMRLFSGEKTNSQEK